MLNKKNEVLAFMVGTSVYVGKVNLQDFILSLSGQSARGMESGRCSFVVASSAGTG